MVAPVLWLAFYLSAGALLMLACYNSSTCRIGARLERNRIIASGIRTQIGDVKPGETPALSKRSAVQH